MLIGSSEHKSVCLPFADSVGSFFNPIHPYWYKFQLFFLPLPLKCPRETLSTKEIDSFFPFSSFHHPRFYWLVGWRNFFGRVERYESKFIYTISYLIKHHPQDFRYIPNKRFLLLGCLGLCKIHTTSSSCCCFQLLVGWWTNYGISCSFGEVKLKPGWKKGNRIRNPAE